MASSLGPTCPFGILNVNAVAETILILHESSKVFHAHLFMWLKENYHDENMAMSFDEAEPLGRRIRSVSDLSILVCAYSNARALKQKNLRRTMDNGLYFYGHLPERDAAVEAGLLLKELPGLGGPSFGHEFLREETQSKFGEQPGLISLR